MLHPKLVKNSKCASISSLIASINCKLNELAFNLYNNTIYELNKSTQSDVMLILVAYKKILIMKLTNPDYCKSITIERIASRVRVLTVGCKCKCIYEAITTTTTTTINP